MAFTNTVEQRFTAGNMCWELGSWEMTAGSGGQYAGQYAGRIFPATLGQGIHGGIRELYNTTFWSDQLDNINQYLPAQATYVDILIPTPSSGVETGRYTLIGRMA